MASAHIEQIQRDEWSPPGRCSKLLHYVEALAQGRPTDRMGELAQ